MCRKETAHSLTDHMTVQTVLQNDYSVFVVHAGESTVEIKTEADSNDITETADPLHDKPSTGMFGFLRCYILYTYSFLCCMLRVCVVSYCFFYTQTW